MRPQKARECRRCGKQAYGSRRQAEDVARWRGTLLRVYECPHEVGIWHLTKRVEVRRG